MMMRIRNALLAATFLAMPLAAQAQPISGLYVGAGAGVNLLQESDVSITGPLATGATRAQNSGTVEFNYGWVGVVSLGYGFGNGVRAEIEASYRQNDVDTISGATRIATPRSAGGTATSYGVMANAFYDFDMGPGSFFTPYVGVGAGYQWHSYDNVRLRNNATGASVTIDGDDGQFAYQAIVGAAFPIAAAPGLAVTAEYRFMGTLQPSIDVRASGTTARGNTDVDNYNHSLLIGLRYAFGVTPPPPPVVAPTPAAAPVAARTYLVFFDFDRADLTDRARQIIGEAATNSRTGTTRIEVSGHADRSGTPQYNQRLSERRAQAVAAELERRGVARSAMSIQAFGESRPLVPTADGVREPQNRRVEIVLR
jgi:outer membrane protein OmpA-like peptidoglycan-associated protein